MENAPNDAPPEARAKLTTLFFGLATLFFCLCLILAGGWYLTWRSGEVNIEDLTPNQVQAFVEQFLDRAPSLLRYAFFEPKIGYTLQPNTKLTAWGDTFTSNELGYRTRSVEKEDNTFRVLFVGDSWTYGQGVSEQESFPYQFAEVANTYAGWEQKITAWTLALPGYNTVNELAALDAFIDQIQPDAVVLCPTGNDIHGTMGVSSEGRSLLQRRGEWQELYLRGFFIVDSYTNKTMWEDTFAAFSRTADRMKQKDLPFFIFMMLKGVDPFVHYHMARADVSAPYAIVPQEFYGGKWRNRGRFGHGTPEVYTVFAKIIYQMVAREVGWQPLPEMVKTQDGAEIPIYAEPPPGDWEAQSKLLIRRPVTDSYDFEPGSKHSARQIKSGLDRETGAASSNPAFIVLKRKSGSTLLRLHLKRLPDARYLYPLEVTATIPSVSGGASVTTHLPEDGPEVQTIDLDIPADIEPGSAIDLIVETPRSILDEHFIARSFYIVRVEQE